MLMAMVSQNARERSMEHPFDHWVVEIPLNEEAVGWDSAVERAACFPVEIGQVANTDAPKPRDIEMGVACLKRVEGPEDLMDAAAQGVVALRQFDEAAEPSILVVGHNGNHVRMKVRVPLFVSSEREREADHAIAIHCTQRLAAEVAGNGEEEAGTTSRSL